MRIKQLELNGFKSFMSRTVLELPLGVTAVVGPNGCGKSNIVDAIRWVLGEQSPKHLRGGSMEDVVFAGNGENGPLGMAEVSLLMELFVMPLEQEVARLHANNVRLKVIGDLSSFEPGLRRLIAQGEALTGRNNGLTLTIAANYGGRWDILQAVNRMVLEFPEKSGNYREPDFAPYLAMNYAPEPDLFIRTGGEQRVSNFLLWQLAYTEFYFTDELWPDFNAQSLARAVEAFQRRERRFGRTSEQLKQADAGADDAPQRHA